MFNSPIINLAILLCFTYLVCSLLVTSINEMIASIASTRSKDLNAALKNLFLENPDWKKYLVDKIETSPHFQSLQSDLKKYPSYIPAKNFSMAVIDSLRDANGNLNLNVLKTKITKTTNDLNLPQPLATTILSFLDKADVTVEDLEKQLGTFYDSAMERVSGLYKRKLNTWTFVISFILAVTLNVDTIEIVRNSLDNPQQLEETSNKIAQQVASGNLAYDGKVTFTIKNDDGTTTVVRTETPNIQDSVKKVDAAPTKSTESVEKIDSTTQKKTTASKNNDTTAIKAAEPGIPIATAGKSTKKLSVQLQKAGVGLGYKDLEDFGKKWTGGTPLTFLLKLLGVILTTFAVRLGAPYWFGMLNKVVNIRGTGIKPAETKKDK